jgi:outer membrane protein TolC
VNRIVQLLYALVCLLLAAQGSAAPPEASDSAFDLPVADRLDPYGPRPRGVPRLSRDQIVRYALENPLVKAAEQNVVAMEAQLRKARFAWIPVIDSSATIAPGTAMECDDVVLQRDSSDPTAPGAPFEFQYCHPPEEELDVQTIKGWFEQLERAGVRITLRANTIIPLYSFGKWKHAKNAAEVGVVIRKLQKLQVRQETIMRVYQAWAAVLLTRESIRILEEGHDVAVDARKRVEKDLGDVDDFAADPDENNLDRDPDDLYRVELAEVELEQLMREARKMEAVSLSALWALAGKAAPPGFDIQEDRLAADRVAGGLGSLKDYKEMAARQRPEAKMASAAIDLRRAQEKLARSSFLPDLGIVVNTAYGWSSAGDKAMSELYYTDGFNFSRFYVALAMRWKLDFHNKAFDLQKARAELSAAEYQRQAALLLLGRDVEEAYQDLVEAKHKIDLFERASHTSWKLVVSQEQRDTVGGGNSNELVRALEKWYRWRFRRVEAVQAHNDALARLGRAVGTDLIDRTPAPEVAQKPGPRRIGAAGD